MPLTVLEHALAAQIVTCLRDETTPPQQFRRLTRLLTQLLAAEATRSLPSSPRTVQTPLEETTGSMITARIVAVPVLRAGLGMLDAVLDFLPDSAVGYIGLQRDEATAIAGSYYCKLPPLAGQVALLLDPMLATGGSAAMAARRIYEEGASRVILLSIVAAPEGVARVGAEFPELHIIAAALDRELDSRKYILPGLGDFGDRLYGTT